MKLKLCLLFILCLTLANFINAQKAENDNSKDSIRIIELKQELNRVSVSHEKIEEIKSIEISKMSTEIKAKKNQVLLLLSSTGLLVLILIFLVIQNKKLRAKGKK